MSEAREARVLSGSFVLLRGDARAIPLADDSVDLIVTSPPYWALRGYTDGGEVYDGQIGNEESPREFVDALIDVTREMMRVLKPSGSLFVNLGDKYAATHTGVQGSSGDRASRAEAASKVRRSASLGGVPAKSLMGIPWRYALRCVDDLGLILRAEIVWAKPNGMPESVKDRVRRTHEQWFHFTKNPSYFSAIDAIREPHKVDWSEGRPTPRAAARQGDAPTATADSPLAFPHELGATPGSWWSIPTEPLRVPEHLDVEHFAAFPTEWPRRLILGWSPSGICTVCGEGRFPVVRDPQPVPGVDVPVSVRSLLGEACACTPRRRREATGDWRDGRRESPAHRNGFGLGSGNAVPSEPLWWYDVESWTPPPTRPAVVLDPFCGTGTTVAVANLLGRRGIGIDLSADYLRLSEWRCTSDRGLRDKVLDRTGIPNPAPPKIDGQMSLL
jgi:DNA modification methylase